MTPPPRRAVRTQPRSSSHAASVLFGIGCLVVLAVTFALGVAAGRRWPNGLPGFTASSDATAAATKGNDRRSEGQGLAKSISESPPVLTFYRELTAPMPPAPPPPRAPAKAEAKPKETVKPRPPEVVKPVAPEVMKPTAHEATEGRFTVQVGAFKTRSQADALRMRLATDGQLAYVSEVEAEGTTQYRVRVGSYTTREAAREAAIRLASERQLATYVTTR
jgi:cell division protein FtsN